MDDADALRKRIEQAGQRREKAMLVRQHESAVLNELIPQAKEAGITVTEIARLARMSRMAVYDVLKST